MHMDEQWQLHCTSQWGQQTLLSRHVYCVAVTFKVTEGVEQWICITFHIKLEHSSAETIWMIPKSTAMSNWWLVTSSRNAAGHASCLVQRFLVKHQITQVTQSSYSSDLSPCNFWLYSKLKSPLKGKRFQTIDEIQENTTGQLLAIGRALWGPEVPIEKGTEVSLSYLQWFLYLVSSSVNISICHSMWLHTFWTDLVHDHNNHQNVKEQPAIHIP